MPVSFPLRIAVVIPVYNAAKFIEAAAASALQFEEVQEVVLVDDAGPDNSLAVCEAIAKREPRVKVLRHPGNVNKGAAESRNLGILNSNSELVAFLDADDFYLPTRFDAERRIFREHPDADGVYGAIAAHYYDETGRTLFNKTFANELTSVRQRVPPEQLFEGLSGGIPDFGYFSLDALTVRRSALMALDPLIRKELQLHEDTDFIFRLAWHARLYPGSIDAPVTMRGVHADNRITQNDRIAHTRHMLYKCLWEWAVKFRVGEGATERFHYRYRYLGLRIATSRTQALVMAVRYRQYMRRYDFRDALFQKLFGAESRVTRTLHKVTWRIYH